MGGIKGGSEGTDNQREMTRRVNYDDNIFYLTLVFKGIAAGLKLNIDTGLYRDRLVEDIRFLDKTCSSIFQSLKADNLMIDRLAHIKGLKKLNGSFIALLEDVLEERLPLASALEQDFDLLQRIQSNREAEFAGLKEMIVRLGEPGSDQEQIVSEQEFKFLLSSDQEEQSE